MYRYLMKGCSIEKATEKPGDPFIVNGVINGRIVRLGPAIDVYTYWIYYTCDKPAQIVTWCCDFMQRQVYMWCEQHGPLCPDQVIRLNTKGIPFLLAENAEYTLTYCPNCGTKVEK